MQNEDTAQVCRQCLASLPAPGPYQQSAPPPYQQQQQQQQQQQYYSQSPYGGAMQAGYPPDWQAMGADKKLMAGLLAIFLGAFGVHKFILGYKTEGIIMIVVSLITCFLIPSIVGLIEGIIYLTKSDEEFVRTYIQGKRSWF